MTEKEKNEEKEELQLDKLTNEELLETYKEIEDQIKYLQESILKEEEPNDQSSG